MDPNMDKDPLEYAPFASDVPDAARDFLRSLMRVAYYAFPGGGEFLAGYCWYKFWDLARALHRDDVVGPDFERIALQSWRHLHQELCPGAPEDEVDHYFLTVEQAENLLQDVAKWENLPPDSGSRYDGSTRFGSWEQNRQIADAVRGVIDDLEAEEQSPENTSDDED